MNISTSPSALMLVNDCTLAYNFNYTQGLRRIGLKRSPTLASGTAVHYAVEQFCQNYPGTKPNPTDLEALGQECLEAEFSEDEDGGAKNVKKFTPGVKRALGRIPDWVWAENWLVEREESVTLTRAKVLWPNSDRPIPTTDTLEIHGRPDMYRVVHNAETPFIEIVDVKTTDKDPLPYMLFSPQLRMYSLMLRAKFPGYLIQYQYVCVPTGATATPPHSAPFIFTERLMAQTVAECWRYAEKMEQTPEQRLSLRCDWCDFKPICLQMLAGNSTDSIIADEYLNRAQRHAQGA